MSFLLLNVVTLHSPAFRIYDKVLVKVSQVRSGVYFSNHLSESIHVWTIVTLESWHSHHDLSPQGLWPWVALEVEI